VASSPLQAVIPLVVNLDTRLWIYEVLPYAPVPAVVAGDGPVKLRFRFMPSGSEYSSPRSPEPCLCGPSPSGPAPTPPPKESLIGVLELEFDMLAWKACEKSFGGAIGALICGIE